MLKSGPIWALGAVSDASLSGVAAALLRSDGDRVLEFGPTAFRPYSTAERAVLRDAFGQWYAPRAATEVVELAFGEVLSGFDGYDMVGFSGHTVAHEPRGRGTLQLGDGGVLAELLGRPVVWDFRSSDVELGGEGAPITAFFDFACARWAGLTGPAVFVDLGAITRVSLIDPARAAPEEPGAVLAFEAGPGRLALRALATPGPRADARPAPESWLGRAWFGRIPPKSLPDSELRALADTVAGVSARDRAQALVAFTAGAVRRAFEHLPNVPENVFLGGAERHDPALVEAIEEATRCRTRPVEAIALNGDFMAAQAHALLAVRVLRGMATSCPGTTGVAAAIGGGRISRPSGG